MQALRGFFASPARQAAAWSTLGILGLALAAAGLLLYNRDASPVRRVVAASDATLTMTASPASSPTPSATPTPTSTPPPSPAASSTATEVVVKPQAPSNDHANDSKPVETPAPEETVVATPLPVVAGGPYCDTISNGRPPSTVIGTFTIGGVAAPLGTAVTLAFDGVTGPSGNSGVAAGGYHIDYAPAGSGCANRVGAAITVIYDGVAYGSGHTVAADASGAPTRIDIAAP
jgi:hypothetical protein